MAFEIGLLLVLFATNIIMITRKEDKMSKYQPSGEGGTRSPPAKSKTADEVWKGVYP